MWSSLRYDELRPLVDGSYRAWLDLLVELIDEGRNDGAIAADVGAAEAAWRLVAIGDGVDSMLYVGLIDRERARRLVVASVRRELRP